MGRDKKALVGKNNGNSKRGEGVSRGRGHGEKDVNEILSDGPKKGRQQAKLLKKAGGQGRLGQKKKAKTMTA